MCLTCFCRCWRMGDLTDSKGRVVDFSHAYVILTSNARCRSSFKPEFLNRLDRVLVYDRN